MSLLFLGNEGKLEIPNFILSFVVLAFGHTEECLRIIFFHYPEGNSGAGSLGTLSTVAVSNTTGHHTPQALQKEPGTANPTHKTLQQRWSLFPKIL